MAFETLELTVDSENVAILTLNRPAKLNSFTAAMHAELRLALDSLEGKGARALVLTGAGKGFCAGQDLEDLDFTPGSMTDPGQLLEENFNPLIRRLQALPLPVIAAVNGVAAGAGANLAFACDLVVAARRASFIQAFVKIGLIPDSGGTWFLPHRVGLARALGLAMTGDKLSAERALEWGLIWDVVDDEQLNDQAYALARRLAHQPTQAIVAIRRTMRTALAQSLEAQLDLERDIQREMGRSQDYTEGVNAFVGKREPKFVGR